MSSDEQKSRMRLIEDAAALMLLASPHALEPQVEKLAQNLAKALTPRAVLPAAGPVPYRAREVRASEALGDLLHSTLGRLCAAGREAQTRSHRADRRTMPVIVIALTTGVFDETVSNMREVADAAERSSWSSDPAGCAGRQPSHPWRRLRCRTMALNRHATGIRYSAVCS